MLPLIVTLFALSDVYIPSGYGRLKTYLADVHEPYLTMLSGDFIGPTNYTSLDGGSFMMDVVGNASIDLISFGNHEFDGPIENLNEKLRRNGYSTFISSNVGGQLRGAVPYVVRKFGNFSIGIVGVCLNDMYYAYDPGVGDPVEAVRYVVENLLPRVDMVVAMTHLRMEGDRRLAESGLVNLILGGHVHDRSIVTVNGVPIVRTGENLEFVASIEVLQKDVFNIGFVRMMNYDVDEKIGRMIEVGDRMMGGGNRIVFKFNGELSSFNMRMAASNMGLFVCDRIREFFGSDLCLVNGGMFRKKVVWRDEVTVGDLMEMFPKDILFVVVEMTGDEFMRALMYSHSVGGLYGGYLHHNSLDFEVEDVAVYQVALDPAFLFGIDHNPVLMNLRHDFRVGDGVSIRRMFEF